MSSAIFQLQTYNAQDMYLTMNPEKTFFLVRFKRYMQFAMESVKVDFSNTPTWGRMATAVLPQAGDLLWRIFLVIDLPAIEPIDEGYIGRWTDKLGYAITKSIKLTIGGNVIDTHDTSYLIAITELSTDDNHIHALNSLIGHTDECTGRYYFRRPSYRLHIPLQFWFCNDPGLALPIVAMSSSRIAVTIDFRKFSECWINCFTTSTGNILSDDSVPNTLDAFLSCEYIWLSRQEQLMFTSQPLEYVITQTQSFSNVSITNIGPNNVSLRFSHPVKCLIWMLQKESHIDTPTENNRWIGNQWNNFSVTTFSPEDIGFTSSRDISFIPSWKTILAYKDTTTTTAPLLSSEIMNWSSFDFAQDGPIDTCQILFNDSAYTPVHRGDYFNKVQTYSHFRRIPDSPGIYCYSFALNASNDEPNGTLNFSSLNKVSLQFTLKSQIENSKCLYPEALQRVMFQNKEQSEYTRPTDAINNVFTKYLIKNTGQFISPLIGTEGLLSSYSLNIYAVNYNVFRVANSIGNIAYVA